MTADFITICLKDALVCSRGNIYARVLQLRMALYIQRHTGDGFWIQRVHDEVERGSSYGPSWEEVLGKWEIECA